MAARVFEHKMKEGEFMMARARAEVDLPGRREPLIQRSVTACGGLEFTVEGWTRVPAGMEGEVEGNPHLEYEIVDEKSVGHLMAEADAAVTQKRAAARGEEAAPAKKASKPAKKAPEDAANAPDAVGIPSDDELNKMSYKDMLALALELELDVKSVGEPKKDLQAKLRAARGE